MIDHETYTQYLAEIKEHDPDYKDAWLRGVLNSTTVPFGDWTEQDVLSVLSRSGFVKRVTFYPRMREFTKFAEIAMKKGVWSKELYQFIFYLHYYDLDLRDSYAKYYFTSFENLYDELHTLFLCRGDAYDTFAASVFLSWFGVRVSDMGDIRKTDLDESAETVYVPAIDRRLSLNPVVTRFLARYRDADCYTLRTVTDKEVVYSYGASEYLLRARGAGHMNTTTLSALSSLANRTLKNVQRRFQYPYIYDSGCYARIREYIRQYGKPSLSEFREVSNLFIFEGDESGGKSEKAVGKKMQHLYEGYRDFAHYMYGE